MHSSIPVKPLCRCVQLVWSADKDNPTVWADLVTKVKEGILSAFDAALTQREEEVKRSEGQRQMPGWNFCTFFILKVSGRVGHGLHISVLMYARRKAWPTPWKE